MFDKLVARINAAIAPEHETQASATDADDLFIGVLDIYGFEIFEVNISRCNVFIINVDML